MSIESPAALMSFPVFRRFLVGKCTVYKLFGLCIVLVLVSVLWLQISCSSDLTPATDGLLRHPPPLPCGSESQAPAADDTSWGPHKLAVIVPFRERFDELLVFVPFIHAFLNRKRIRHRIFIINQVDHYR